MALQACAAAQGDELSGHSTAQATAAAALGRTSRGCAAAASSTAWLRLRLTLLATRAWSMPYAARLRPYGSAGDRGMCVRMWVTAQVVQQVVQQASFHSTSIDMSVSMLMAVQVEHRQAHRSAPLQQQLL